MPGTLFATDSRRKVDYFQRRKVGSIRDNPKLMKIRQQFENASKKKSQERSDAKEMGNSFSINLPNDSKTSVATKLLKIDSNLSESSLYGRINVVSQTRRRSEGDNKSISVQCNKEQSKSKLPSSSVFEVTDGSASSSVCDKIQKNHSERKYEFQNSMLETKMPTNSLPNEDSFTDLKSEVSTISFNNTAPPIPKRGISPSVQNSFMQPQKDTKQTSDLLFKVLTLREEENKSNGVQKAIELYEGMSTITGVKKNKTAKNCSSNLKSFKREDSVSRRLNSRRNSLRRSKHFSEKSESSMKKRETDCQKEDNGVLSDNDDRNQSIYQTLSTANISHTFYDPYDRLNRIHDAVSHIHKGQTSSCAACKAIPSSVLQLQDTDSPFVEVQCNELAPHHHPPCICFSCQHSIFSCSTNSDVLAVSDGEGDGLYYNICCLNPPNRESWRQSRRRPVCEQNGRLCVVNCDMEKHTRAKMTTDKFYENLSECRSHSPQLLQQKDSTKQVSADSCESDEGWVDVTDSEDEKSFSLSKRDLSSNSDVFNLSNALQSTSYEIDQIVSHYNNLDLSKSLSTEHLYESITDVEPDDLENSENPETSSLRSDQAPENDLDSGEWSTESGSPVFNESSDKTNQKESLNQSRFTVGYESQETAKKTFMKSVLGKKVPNSTKKRRMSNFFVPWLVSNTEYSSAHFKNPKTCSKKQAASISPKQSSSKTKRSQSVTPESPKLSLSCTKSIFCSTEMLDKCKTPESASSSCNLLSSHSLSPQATPSMSSRSSVASSAYIRTDLLQCNETPRRKTSLTSDTAVDVCVERVCRRSSTGNSEHSYILFTPIKEDQVPLYQFYERNIKERVSFCRSSKSLSPIMWSSIPENSESCTSQFSVVEQLSPDATDLKMLWCELPEVKESGILERISAQELKLQEALFEFIQSQASYIRSLKVLYENFIRMPEFSDIDSSILSKHEQDVLFSDIVRVKEVSERILGDITAKWNDILIPDICDIIYHHTQLPTFSVYIKYCSNRVYQERTLKELKESRLYFLEALRKLESNPICQGLSLESFLVLPIQHIARMPLLLDNIFSWLTTESPSYGICKSALEAMHKIFVKCNEGARKMERLEEMFVLNKQLEFKEIKVIPLISASRWLLKKGELMKLEFDKKTFGRSNRCVKIPVFIFLFNDLVVFTKRKNDDCYIVLDYCTQENMQATAINAKDLQQPLISPNTCRYLIYLKLLSNHQGASIDMILNCTLLSERTRWIEAMLSETQNKSSEISEYDCPQVQCFKNYIAQQPDELSLQESDVVTIHRKMNDGWYEGRRLRDGLQGWFPASYTVDIPCSRARASNLRQCYRLLMLSKS